MYNVDHSLKTPKELCQIINQWTAKEKMKFWKHLEKYIDPSKTHIHQQEHYQKQYERHLYSECLSQDDIQYIGEFYQKNIDLLLCEQKQQLMDGHFKNRDIFHYDVYKRLSLCKKNQQQIQSNSIDIVQNQQQSSSKCTTKLITLLEENQCIQMKKINNISNVVNSDEQDKQTFQRKQQIDRTNYHTTIYQYTLTLLTNQDCGLLSPQQICEQIDTLDETQKQKFWQLVFEHIQPQKQKYDLRKYYKNTYQKALYNPITDLDKKFIKTFCSNLKEIPTNKEVTNQLMESQFKDKNLFYFDVYYQVRNDMKNMKQQKPKTNTQHITSQLAHKVEKSVETKLLISAQRRSEKTQVYKEILNIIQQEDCSEKSPKEICQMILQLDQTTSKRFWQIVVSQTLTNYMQQKTYFRVQYCQVLFSEKLTDDDKQNIFKYVEDKLSVTTTELTQQLFSSYFKERDLFFYEVYKQISTFKSKFQFKHSNYYKQESQQVLQSYTGIYQQGLNFVLGQDCTNLTPQEICNTICQLKSTQRLTFWYYLARHVIPKTKTNLLYRYYLSYVRKHFTDKLNKDDIEQIAKEYELYLSTKLNKIEITQQIVKSLFQNRCLYFRSVYLEVVQLDKQHGINSNYKIKIYNLGTCKICKRNNVQNYCQQCESFFCRRCKNQHVKDTLHFEFGFK
ncbi:B-box-type_zinc finger [Hexamita inflata]|uniref:B-box-type zinc finger n=1 Tax=Hexamita inflata TaxID=28002 RepID=A0AA86R9N9_9EUKA|nr:B-box-type zinc finger [Hexamita inflata]